MGQKRLSSTFSSTGYESFQWQPLIASHDPNPPITLEDNYLNGIEYPELAEYDPHLYEPFDFQQSPLPADVPQDLDQTTVNRVEVPADLDLYSDEEPLGESAAPRADDNEQPYPTEQPADLSLYEPDPDQLDDLLTQLGAPTVPIDEYAATEWPTDLELYDPFDSREDISVVSWLTPADNEQPYPTEQPQDLDLYSDEEPLGEAAAPLAADNEQPYPVEFPASLGEYDPDEVFEADLYTQLQAPRVPDNEQPYPTEQPADIELYAEEEPIGEAAPPLAADNDQPYPTEQPADLGPYEPDPDQIDDLLTQLQAPRVPDNEQPYPTEQPADIELYAEEEPIGEAAPPLAADNDQPYPTEQPADLGPYEPDPDQIDDLLTQLQAPLSDPNEQPYPTEQPLDLDLYSDEEPLGESAAPLADDNEQPYPTEQPQDLDLYSDEEPLGEAAAPLADDNDQPYPVEFPASLGEYDPDEVFEADLYTQLQTPLADDNEQPYPTEQPADIELYAEEEPIGETAPPLADDNDQPYPTEQPQDLDLYSDEEPSGAVEFPIPPDNEVSEEADQEAPEDLSLYEIDPEGFDDRLTQLQTPLADDNEQPYPTEQPVDIELYAEEEPLGETAPPLADDNEQPYPTEQPVDIELYAEEEPLGETAGPLSANDEQPYPTEQPADLDLYDPYDWLEEVYSQVFWTTPEDNDPVPFPVEDSFTITFGDFDEEPEGSVFWTMPEDNEQPFPTEQPADMDVYDPFDSTEDVGTFFWTTPADVHSVSAVVAVEPVLKDGTLTPFTVVVWDGFLFADADFVPPSTVFKLTAAGPLLVHSVPVLVKRPATIGLYDGTFTPSVIAVGGAPEVYLVTADVTLADDTRRWGTPTMAIGPCPP